ncbi:Dihydrofolate reductase [Dyadobacter soli]|uniref:Dihydrofolate reductase n=1 Tax=Dyadobacter soli TaxID=659014 RepID=A0A1G7MP28_9BACT|nr:dihydrofolate reductase family protein [Dyadobacter soli]SDF63386.1 Dihydrofolate reductase [Dyadobacter soli]
MRKVILQEWVSLDGFAADRNGTTDFFSSPKYAEGSDAELLEFMDGIGTILLGANTYKMFVEYWPDVDPETELIANRLNQTPKLVFSKTLREAPWGKWEACQVIDAELTSTIRHLKNEQGKDMVLWGSLSVAQQLMQAGLIDEFQIRVVPILLGAGRPLFAQTGQQLPLDCVESRSYPSGITLISYRPAHIG